MKNVKERKIQDIPDELKEKKMQQLVNMPIIETRVFKSKDGNCIIHKTTITDIKSVKYYEAVMSSINREEDVV